jgi:ribonuclease HII
MMVAGVDEAGRGPLAGPVVCAAVILPTQHSLCDLNDSKKLSAKQRERLYDEIQKQALAFSIVFIGPEEIDTYNILQATLLGMSRAIEQLSIPPNLALIDGNRLPNVLTCPAQSVVKGDSIYPCIMAASILAKVSRDRYMQTLHENYPQFGFDQHKGYPTTKHMEALNTFGACPEHRRSFAPVKNALKASQIGQKSL